MVSFTAPDGARAERVKETAAHRRMRRARSEARIMLRLVQACSVLQGHHGTRFRGSSVRSNASPSSARRNTVWCQQHNQCDVGVGTVDAEAQCETHGESSEAQKVDYATQCDFDSHEDYDLVSGQMALLTGLVGKKQLNGKLGWLERPVNNSRQRWGVLVAGEEAVVSIATQNLVRVPPSELGNAVTNLMAQLDHGAVQRFLSLMDTTGVVSMESESEPETESKAVRNREAPPSPERSKRRKR